MMPHDTHMHKNPEYPYNKIAVAVSGEAGRQAKLVAKGRGALAEQILAVAFENEVKVREDSTLIDMLVACEVDSPIPLPALEAVCAVLSHVYAATHRDRPEGF